MQAVGESYYYTVILNIIVAMAMDRNFNNNLQTMQAGIKNVLVFFIPVRGYIVTPLLLIANIAIFIAMVISGADILNPDTDTLIVWGADYGMQTLDGEWWRLITGCFLHIGIFHLAVNMGSLVFIGELIERIIGSTRFLTAYILTGVGGSLASVFWDSYRVSAGASGALFGMFGVFVALLTTRLFDEGFRRELLVSVVIMLVFNLIYGITGLIDNAAHIGGLATGLLIGYLLYFPLSKPESSGLKNTATVIALVFCTGFYIFYRWLSPDIVLYNKNAEKYSELHAEANAIANNDSVLQTNELEIIIRKWDSCEKLMSELKGKRIPHELAEYAENVVELSSLVKRNYTFYLKGQQEQTDFYDDSIRQYNFRIESLYNKMEK